jgi:hypothetical protein
MGSVSFPTNRARVVSALVVSLGLVGVFPCGSDRSGGGSRACASHSNPACVCGAASENCECGAACNCGQQSPQKRPDPIAPTSTDDRFQTLAVVARIATCSGAAATFSASFDSGWHSAADLTLIAQRTRLNI